MACGKASLEKYRMDEFDESSDGEAFGSEKTQSSSDIAMLVRISSLKPFTLIQRPRLYMHKRKLATRLLLP